MIRRALYLTSLAVLLTTFQAFAGPVEVRLDLDENAILPGMPTGFTVTVTNLTSAPVALPSRMWLTASGEREKSFVIPVGRGGEASFPISEQANQVLPKGSRIIRIDVVPGVALTPFMLDPRISSPGKYYLSVVLAETISPEGDFNHVLSFASNDVELNIAVSSAADIAVWNWIRTHGDKNLGGFAWMRDSSAFSEFVVENHPDSKYMLVAAQLVPENSPTEKAKLLEGVMARFPDSSYSDTLRLEIALRHYQLYMKAVDAEKFEEAAVEAGRVHSLTASVDRQGRSDHLREAARELAGKTATRQQIEEFQRIR